MTGIEVSDRESIDDWIETTVLARGTAIGHDALFAIGAEELEVSEAGISLAFGVLESRSRVLGDCYPFVTNEVGVYPRTGAVSYPYSLLLLVSPGNPVRQLCYPAPESRMVVAFENLVVEAAASLIGKNGMALRFGWPSEIGRPPEFDGAVRWLADRMGINPGGGYRQPRRKDGGVDVVAWAPFPDIKLQQ